MPRQKSSVRWFSLPENRSAELAVDDLLMKLRQERSAAVANPLYLHGPSGVGKSQLVAHLVAEVCRGGSWTVRTVAAGDFHFSADKADAEPEVLQQARQTDLWILEDVQLLPARSLEGLAQVLEFRGSRQLPTVITARVGPRFLRTRDQRFPARLTGRLATGLVVALEIWQAPSRLLFLEELAQRRQFAVGPDILRWLADNLPGSGRVLEGAMNQLETLAAQQRKALELAQVTQQFHSQAQAHEPTVDRIVRTVSGYFRLESGLLQSRCRLRNILLPRQVSMFLARQLTELSLEQIGTFFGGRDHTTVLHACRKVEQALETDPALCGAVKQIHAQLA